MATSPRPSRGPEIGRHCYVTLPFSGVPWKKGQNQNWLHYLAFSGAQDWAQLLCHPCVLKNQKWLHHPCLAGGPKVGRIATSALCPRVSPDKGTKTEVATPTLPSQGPKTGQNCYLTRALSRIPKKGDKIRNGYTTPAFSWYQKWAEVRRNPCVFGRPHNRAQSQKWLPQPCLLGGQGLGGVAM